MKKRYFPLLFLTLCLASWADNATTSKQPMKIFGYTYHAASIKIVAVPDQKNTYIATVYGVPNEIIWVADRPERIKGIMKMNDFIKKWQDKDIDKGFGTIPPNATLEWIPENEEETHPFLHGTITSAEYDESHHVETYQIVPFDNEPQLPPVVQKKNAWVFITGHKT